MLLWALVDDISDMLINILKFTLTDTINPRMISWPIIQIHNLITGSVSISSAWVVSVIVADRGLIVVDCNILVGMLLYLPFVTNAVWCCRTIIGILKIELGLNIKIWASCCLSINRSRQWSIIEIVHDGPTRLLFDPVFLV